MAVYSGNKYFLVIGGVRLDDLLRNAGLTVSANSIEVTSGATGYKAEIITTKQYELSLTFVYDLDRRAVLLPLLSPGVRQVTYGPEGSTAGLPKHQQDFAFKKAGTEGSFEKALWVFSVTATSTGEPIADFFKGDTF